MTGKEVTDRIVEGYLFITHFEIGKMDNREDHKKIKVKDLYFSRIDAGNAEFDNVEDLPFTFNL